MKRVKNHPTHVNPKWIMLISTCSILSLIVLFFTTLVSPDSIPFLTLHRSGSASLFVEYKLRPISPTPVSLPPRLAYLISGTVGDCGALKRTLQALYHPHNLYIIHLDLESPQIERSHLRDYIRNHPAFSSVKNVWMMEKANLVTYRGPTMVANTLHAAAILLKEGGEWDWFINLSASDYPLVTQDDLLHTFSYLPRDLNFVDHTSNIGWKEFQRAKPIIVDPGLYMTKKNNVFWVKQRRSVPTAFKLFTGSSAGTLIFASSSLKLTVFSSLLLLGYVWLWQLSKERKRFGFPKKNMNENS